MSARAICLLVMPLAAVVVAGLATDPPAAGQEPYREPLRPRVHFTPAQNFMNDPNGLVFSRASTISSTSTTRSATDVGSHELGACRQPRPAALGAPALALREENGVMIFSGSAVVDSRQHERALRGRRAIGHASSPSTPGTATGKQTQNLAYSNDRGRTWTKYAGNPVIDLEPGGLSRPEGVLAQLPARWVMVTVLADAAQGALLRVART